MNTTKTKPLRLYDIRLIHRQFDWNASFQFLAPNARKAREWALWKMKDEASWLVTSARIAKNGGGKA